MPRYPASPCTFPSIHQVLGVSDSAWVQKFHSAYLVVQSTENQMFHKPAPLRNHETQSLWYVGWLGAPHSPMWMPKYLSILQPGSKSVELWIFSSAKNLWITLVHKGPWLNVDLFPPLLLVLPRRWCSFSASCCACAQSLLQLPHKPQMVHILS